MAEPPRLDLLQGTLDMLVLRALTWGPRHGYGIARLIEQRTNDALAVEEGSLYPALHRMVGRGWVTAEWGTSENNRRAKYYTITRTGRAQLSLEERRWLGFVRAIASMLNEQPA